MAPIWLARLIWARDGRKKNRHRKLDTADGQFLVGRCSPCAEIEKACNNTDFCICCCAFLDGDSDVKADHPSIVVRFVVPNGVSRYGLGTPHKACRIDTCVVLTRCLLSIHYSLNNLR